MAIPTQHLNQKITIQEKTKAKNDKFEWVTTWVDKATIWCSVKQQYFRDFKETYGTALEDTTNFVVRYEQRFQLQNDMRVVYKGVNYEIVSILEGSYDRDFTTLVCKRVKK